jgi:hypothetical protein
LREPGLHRRHGAERLRRQHAVARQTGGKSLYAQFDAAEPAAPKRACLSGTRTAAGSTLEWKSPDHGGAAISGYQILRGTTPARRP